MLLLFSRMSTPARVTLTTSLIIALLIVRIIQRQYDEDVVTYFGVWLLGVATATQMNHKFSQTTCRVLLATFLLYMIAWRLLLPTAYADEHAFVRVPADFTGALLFGAVVFAFGNAGKLSRGTRRRYSQIVCRLFFLSLLYSRASREVDVLHPPFLLRVWLAHDPAPSLGSLSSCYGRGRRVRRDRLPVFTSHRGAHQGGQGETAAPLSIPFLSATKCTCWQQYRRSCRCRERCSTSKEKVCTSACRKTKYLQKHYSGQHL